jgi:hypothetical protein
MLDFIVLGLPRSATTWLANWLTTDRSLCLHDPFAKTLPEQWDAGGKRLGISCTGAYLMPDWLDAQACPVAIIERNPEDCDASLAALGQKTTWPLRRAFNRARGMRWRFDDIWNEHKARQLWAFLLPGLPFDAARYRLLLDMRVTPTAEASQPCPSVTHELLKRGWLAMEG